MSRGRYDSKIIHQTEPVWSSRDVVFGLVANVEVGYFNVGPRWTDVKLLLGRGHASSLFSAVPVTRDTSLNYLITLPLFVARLGLGKLVRCSYYPLVLKYPLAWTSRPLAHLFKRSTPGIGDFSTPINYYVVR